MLKPNRLRHDMNDFFDNVSHCTLFVKVLGAALGEN